jgi:sec-independent protein translocase protein TatA
MFTGLFQPSHIIILAIVALVFLGPKRIPEAARSLGHAFREFKGSIGDHDDSPDHAPVAVAAAPAPPKQEQEVNAR